MFTEFSLEVGWFLQLLYRQYYVLAKVVWNIQDFSLLRSKLSNFRTSEVLVQWLNLTKLLSSLPIHVHEISQVVQSTAKHFLLSQRHKWCYFSMNTNKFNSNAPVHILEFCNQTFFIMFWTWNMTSKRFSECFGRLGRQELPDLILLMPSLFSLAWEGKESGGVST